MNRETLLWLTVLGMGLITYAIRLVFIALEGRLTLPPLVTRALRYVPPAVLSAIIFPEVFRPTGILDISPGNARLAAGLLAAVVAWRTRNVLWTLVAGMIAFWLHRALLG